MPGRSADLMRSGAVARLENLVRLALQCPHLEKIGVEADGRPASGVIANRGDEPRNSLKPG